MSPRQPNIMKWSWCVFVLCSGSVWSPVTSGSVRNPPKKAPGIEEHAKFFQDFFSVQLSPHKIEFGHVCEDPNNWEQRYEKKDFKNHRDMGKVRWGDKQGGYGEHYWDLNHAGHADNHGNDGYDDDGYSKDDSNDSYDEPSDNSPLYETSDETPNDEETPKYDSDERNRSKRAHSRVNNQPKASKNPGKEEQAEKLPRRNKEHLQTAYTHDIERVTSEIEDEPQRKQRKHRRVQHIRKQVNDDDEEDENEEQIVKKNVKTVEKPTKTEKEQTHAPTKYVPYEHGSGVRQHHQKKEIVPAASTPRLFWEPSTGHVVDRTTGQAYILQPIHVPIQ